jgi:hypothetical protein
VVRILLGENEHVGQLEADNEIGRMKNAARNDKRWKDHRNNTVALPAE